MLYLASTILLLQAALGESAGWVYANKGKTVANAADQAATWGGAAALCTAGKEQSPVNVVTNHVVQTIPAVITTHFDTTVSYAMTTSHGFQLFETSPIEHKYDSKVKSTDVSKRFKQEYDKTMSAKGYSMIGGSKYNFYQVHWHTPSENTIDGLNAAMEAHFVHQLANDPNANAGNPFGPIGYHRLAVIGLMYQLGLTCNAELAKFWDFFPESVGIKEYTGTNINFNLLIADELAKGYYHWAGSLTTPPCTEGVSWNLLTTKEKTCQAQVNTLKSKLSANQDGTGFNNRVTQPLNHRAITLAQPGNHRPKPTNTAILPPASAKWYYANKGDKKANAAKQTATWGGLCATGHEQSPIDVKTVETVKGASQLPTIVTHFDTTDTHKAGQSTLALTYVKNTGHGFQLFETKPTGNTLDGTGTPVAGNFAKPAKGYTMIANRVFNFYQVHWHTPSENTVDGKHFPMEAHFVHQLNDTALVGGYHRLAVIGLLYELGSSTQCNTVLAHFWDKFPSAAGAVSYAGVSPDFNAMLKDELAKGYYHWMGSLTTPPCTEGVSWNLLKTKEKVCQAQVNMLSGALSVTQDGIGFNNRVAQPLNHRVVTEQSPLLGTQPQKNVSQAQWKLAIETGGVLGMYIQKMSKDFLYVAKDMNVTANRADMFKNVNTFAEYLDALMYGVADLHGKGSMVPAPTQRILDQLYDVQFKWVSLRRLLEDNVDTVRSADGSTNFNILERVYFENLPTLLSADVATDEYKNAAMYNGMHVQTLRVDIAARQRMLIQKMSKEATFVGLEIHTDESLTKLANTMSLFVDSHYDIVRGVGSIAEMPELTDMCTLYEMKTVNGKWDKMQPDVSKILDDYGATDAGLMHISESNLIVLEEMEKALWMYTHTNNVCDPEASMNGASWDNIMAELGKQRMRTQQVIALFYQIVRGVHADQARQDLDTAMAQGEVSLRLCIEGSYYLNIPSPPTQEIVDQVIYAEHYWKKFTAHVSSDLMVEDMKTIDLSKMTGYGDKCNTEINAVAGLYINSSLNNNPAVRSVVIEISWRQMRLLQVVVRQALLVSLENNVQANRVIYEQSVIEFQAQHSELLHGRSLAGHRRLAAEHRRLAATPGVEVLFPDNIFTATKDACTLTMMMEMLTHFIQLNHELHGVLDEHGDMEDAQEIHQIEQALVSRAAALSAMTTAVEYYVDGHGTCSTKLTKAEWESGLEMAGHAGQFFEEALKDYFLIASGTSGAWEAESAAAEAVQREYMSDDVSSPVLLEALTAFNRGWSSMGDDDDERMTALQTLYVVANPNPVGSKYLLEFAAGTQEYHVAHKNYHAGFRDTAFAHKYQDLYLFSIAGNLIYSVHKYLDYATNFAAKEEGAYRDTGLGQAYRAAKADEVKMHETPWEPYGPLHFALASFLSKAVLSSGGVITGVYATMMPEESRPIRCETRLEKSIEHFDGLLESLEFGIAGTDVAPPATQRIADAVFGLYDQWDIVVATLVAPATLLGVEDVMHMTHAFEEAAHDLTKAFVDEAWAADKSVPGTKIEISGNQMSRLQMMAKDLVLMSVKDQLLCAETSSCKGIKTPEEFQLEMAEFTKAHNLLMTGNAAGRRLDEHEIIRQKTDVTPSEDPLIVKIMEDVMSEWDSLSGMMATVTTVDEITGNTQPVTSSFLKHIVKQTDEAQTAMQESVSFMASKMKIDTMETVHILTPVPLTGSWIAGQTMRTAAMLAESIINEEQLILPGFNLIHVFFDDKCDPLLTKQTVLREMASNVEYVALGGVGCDQACADTAFIAASVRLPFLSYECAGASLSDTSEYPDFTRIGTITTPTTSIIQHIGTNFAEWNFVEVISGDPAQYRELGEKMVSDLAEKGMSGQYAYAYDTQWKEIVDLMDQLRIKKRRVILVMGSESYFRKIICASIVVKANKGISWLSEGAWREGWWKLPDLMLDNYKLYFEEDTNKAEVVEAMADFKSGWNTIAADDPPTDAGRSTALQAYKTEEKEALEYLIADGEYHAHHKKYHGSFRELLVERNYYDLYFFDGKGNMIYSVYKDFDFATNFGSNTNLLAEFSKYQSSGLGEAFRAAQSEPNVIAVSTWAPYGPQASVASFMVKAVRTQDEAALIVGYMGVQLPTSAKSIEDVEPECTLDAITASFEGAINVVGLGKPLDADMGKQVPCFEGRTVRAFLQQLDHALEHGIDGDESTKVAQPFNDLKAHAADGTCVFAYALRHLRADGHDMKEIESHTMEIYEKFTKFIKHKLNTDPFQGASGLVQFKGNDKPAYLAIQQVQQGEKVQVGTCSYNVSIDLSLNGGPSNASWKPAHPDPLPPAEDFPYWAFQVFMPVLCICCPALAACVKNF